MVTHRTDDRKSLLTLRRQPFHPSGASYLRGTNSFASVDSWVSARSWARVRRGTGSVWTHCGCFRSMRRSSLAEPGSCTAPWSASCIGPARRCTRCSAFIARCCGTACADGPLRREMPVTARRRCPRRHPGSAGARIGSDALLRVRNRLGRSPRGAQRHHPVAEGTAVASGEPARLPRATRGGVPAPVRSAEPGPRTDRAAVRDQRRAGGGRHLLRRVDPGQLPLAPGFPRTC